jgi:hypothetical protein
MSARDRVLIGQLSEPSPRALPAPSEKAAHDGEQFRLVEQECVVTLVRDDFGERHPCARRIERLDDGARLGSRKQPVAGERDDAEPRGRAMEGLGQNTIVIGCQIEIIHCPRQIEIGVRIEALDERNSLMPQIGLDLEIRIERKSRIRAILELAAELSMQRCVGQVGNVRAHARHRESPARIGVFEKVSAAAPFGVGHDRLPADFMKRDVLRRMPRCAGNRQRGKHALRIACGPLQDLHAAHGSACDR